MTPKILFSHFPFGRNLEAIRTHCTSRSYAGVEWNLEQWRIMVARVRRRKVLEDFRHAATLCSVHAPYIDLEIGHGDAELAAASLRLLRGYVDLAADLGAHHVNIHVGASGLGPDELSWDTLLRNLSAILEHGARRQTPVTVENLRRGMTSEPETFSKLLRATGAPVTFDHGHAQGSAWVQEGRGSAADVLGAIPTPILASHLYLIERDDLHFPPQDVGEMREVLASLRARGCDFWVLELQSQPDLEQTRHVIDGFLAH